MPIVIAAVAMLLAAARSESDAQLRARCPTTRNLAPAMFSAGAGVTTAALDTWQANIRGDRRIDPVPSDATISLRAFAGSSVTQSEPSEAATQVWRMPDGRWHFVAVEHYLRRQATPPATAPDIRDAARGVETGLLDSRQSAALDALLADPCLRVEPAEAGSELAVRDGVVPPDPCYDAASEVLEIARGDTRAIHRQYCHKFLVGELLDIALYPHREDRARAAREAGWTIGSVTEARKRGDTMIATYSSAANWRNVTATTTTELAHRQSGFRCAFDWDPSASVFGTPQWDAAAQTVRCFMHRNPIDTRTDIARALPKRGLTYRMMDAAPQTISTAWVAQPGLHRIGSVRIDGRRVSRVVLPDFPRADARTESYTVILGTKVDGWTVVQATTGTASNKAQVEAVSRRAWRQLMATRGQH